MNRRSGFPARRPAIQVVAVAEPMRAPVSEVRPDRRGLRLALLAALLLFAGSAMLWVRYGSAVFVELLAAAWVVCF